MCGIAGAFHPDALSPAAIGAVRKMQSALIHRGPDGEGWFQSRRAVLAHRRLSIIDVDGGQQPLRGESAGVVAVVNGEVYNYVELRRELLARGARLRTQGDSEVVPWLYERDGANFVEALRGAYALALWDEDRQQLTLVRDRVGEKPLAYATGRDGTFYFASEIGALVASGMVPLDPDPIAINRYFHFRFVPEPATPLAAVRKLPAGHRLVLSPESPIPLPSAYWSVSQAAPLSRDPIELIRADLEEVGRIIVRSDVPVGVALSGGLDSSIVASLAARHAACPVKAFSVGYPGRPACDERADAAEFARHLGVEFVEVELEASEVVDGFDALVTDMAEPIADVAGSSYRAVMRAARREGIKVMFQGQGADELFWSYGWMRQALQENMTRDTRPGILDSLGTSLRARMHMPSISSPRRFAQWVVQGGGFVDALEQYERIRRGPEAPGVFWDVARPLRRIANEVARIAGPALAPQAGLEGVLASFPRRESGESWRRWLVRAIVGTYLLENGISQADRYSMAAGVEARLPFVDHVLVEHAVGLNDGRPDAVTPGKTWLRAAVADHIPSWVLSRPKRGFSPPTRDWVASLVRERGPSLATGELVTMGLLSRAGVQLLARPSGPFDRGLRDQIAYQTLVLEQWFKAMQTRLQESREL